MRPQAKTNKKPPIQIRRGIPTRQKMLSQLCHNKNNDTYFKTTVMEHAHPLKTIVQNCHITKQTRRKKNDTSCYNIRRSESLPCAVIFHCHSRIAHPEQIPAASTPLMPKRAPPKRAHTGTSSSLSSSSVQLVAFSLKKLTNHRMANLLSPSVVSLCHS